MDDLLSKVNSTNLTTKASKSESCILAQEQIIHELENERLYLEMASWCDYNGLTETAQFFYCHAGEERKHATDFLNFMLKQHKRAKLGATKEMKSEYDDLTEVLTDAIKREKETTKLIQNLLDVSRKEHSFLVDIALTYVHEQLEEEQLFLSLLNLWKICDGSKIDFEMEVGKLKSDGSYKLGSL